MTFGEKLKAARTSAGLKQSELAKQLNTTGNTISNWENNVSKPDLDTLSYICGILNVKASYFLQAKVPEDEITLTEFNIIKKYRDLDNHGKEMVDFTLQKEWERAKEFLNTKDKGTVYSFAPSFVAEECTPYGVNAAHARTDIEVTDDMLKHDDDIMDADDF